MTSDCESSLLVTGPMSHPSGTPGGRGDHEPSAGERPRPRAGRLCGLFDERELYPVEKDDTRIRRPRAEARIRNAAHEGRELGENGMDARDTDATDQLTVLEDRNATTGEYAGITVEHVRLAGGDAEATAPLVRGVTGQTVQGFRRWDRLIRLEVRRRRR